jgi:hypothetical protein
MNIQTKSLFHFTQTFDNLKSILKEGFWPQYCLEDFSWIEGAIPRIAVPMVSFCDIPVSKLRAHTARYGKFGIGLCRKRWRVTGLNPLLYVSSGSLLKPFLGEVLIEMGKHSNPRIRTGAMVLLAHCKQLEGCVEANGEKRDFYSECEWRFVPWVEPDEGKKYGFFLTEQDFRSENILKEANEERRKDRMLDFMPDNVSHVIVTSDEDARNLAEFIDAEMVHYPPDALNLLKSRIQVLTRIRDDLLKDWP